MKPKPIARSQAKAFRIIDNRKTLDHPNQAIKVLQENDLTVIEAARLYRL